MTKKIIPFIMCLVLLVCFAVGCKKSEQSGEDGVSQTVAPFGQADNDILTYQKIDYTKTQLVVSCTGNITYGRLNSAFMEKHPDIQVIYMDITGGNSEYCPVDTILASGDVPDIMITSGDFLSENALETYFTDLSGNPVTSRFQTSTLKEIAVNQRNYSLPGLSKLSAIAYNKTIFEQNDWSVPKTVDEFVALCNTIETALPEAEAFNPNAKYSNELGALLQGMCYNEVFAGIENRQWLNDFLDGSATYSEHMQPMYTLLQKLIDNEILKESHFTYSATTRGNKFRSGEILMINNKLENIESDTYEFGYFPFPGATEDDPGWVWESLDCQLAVPKKAHTPAVQTAIDKYLDFYASAEGQRAFISSAALSSNLKYEYFTSQTSDSESGLTAAINAGHKFSLVEFYNDTTSLNFSFGTEALAMINGTRTAAQSMAYVDANCRSPRSVFVPTKVAAAAESFTTLEVSNLFADMFKEETGADIALIANNVAYRGNLMQIPKGDVTDAMISVLLPRSYANNSQLITVKMTGAQLLAALQKPLGNGRVSDCVYAFSGLKCTVAPWNELGSKVLSATLADGTAIDATKLYTVACWQGTVYDEFITETVTAYGNYNASETDPDNSFTALLTKYLTAKGTISPSRDGRITLKWD